MAFVGGIVHKDLVPDEEQPHAFFAQLGMQDLYRNVLNGAILFGLSQLSTSVV